MKNKTIFIYSLSLASLTLFSSCKEEVPSCTAPRLVIADQECYTGGGLALTASDFGDRVDGLVWNVYANQDSTNSMGLRPQELILKMLPGPQGKYTVPDSVLQKYRKLLVTVDSNCNGIIQSAVSVFVFVKTKSATENCTKWLPR